MLDSAIPSPRSFAADLALVARNRADMQAADMIAQWHDLATQASDPNPFFENWYLLPALRAFDPGHSVTLLCLEQDGRLLGLMPVQRCARYYGRPLPHWRIWSHANAFLGAPLAVPGYEAALWHMAACWLDRQGGAALFLHCPQVPVHGPAGDGLRFALQDGQRQHSVVLRQERAMLHSDLSPDEYWEQALSGKKRKELRRQHRRLEEDSGTLVVERLHSAEGLDQWIREFLALEQSGWKGRAGSALACDPATSALFSAALAGAAAHGRLERLAIRTADRPLAMLASFLCDGAAFSYKTAYDESYARFSPGVLLQRENLAMLCDPHFAWADSCAAADHPMIDHIWRERRTVASVNLAIGGPLRRAAFRALNKWEMRRGMISFT